MLVVKTELHETKNKGIGLYASQDIRAGDTVWLLEDVMHKVITDDEYKNMKKLQKDYIDTYATYHACGVQGYFLDLDNTRFINHSEYPNIEFSNKDGHALRDIYMGEEITCDYRKLSDYPEEKILGFEDKE